MNSRILVPPGPAAVEAPSSARPSSVVARLGAEGDAPLWAGTTVRSLRGVRAPDGSLVDLLIDSGHIVDVLPSSLASHRLASHQPAPDTTTASAGLDVEARGWRVLPAASEPHAHLDKALSAPRVDPRRNDLDAAITQWRELLTTIDSEDIYHRARQAVQRYVTRGITSIRTHVDLPSRAPRSTGTPDPLRGVDALIRLRDELRGTVTLQLVALVASDTPDSVVDAAAERGIDLIGGCPHLAPDPPRETERLLDAADRHGLPVDLHTDEQLTADEVDLVTLCEQVLRRRFPYPVTASHCVRLGSLPPDRLLPVLDLAQRAGIGIVTLPITNLYLQGRDATHLAPRGLAAVQAILDAGIPLGAGGDNLRDPFNPMGRADPFETTSLLVTAGHLTPDDAFAAVTTGARAVMGLPPVGVQAGRPADLMLVPDIDLGDVLAGQVDARVVLHAGRVLADTRVVRSVDLPTMQAPGPTAAADQSTAHGVRR